MKKILEISRVFTLIFLRDKVTLFFNFFFNAMLMIIFGLTINDKYDLTFTAGIVDNLKTESSDKVVAFLKKQPNMIIKTLSSEKELNKQVSDGILVAGIVLKEKTLADASGMKGGNNDFAIEILGDQSRNMWLKFLIPGLKVALSESNPLIKEQLEATMISTKFIESRNLRYFDFIFPGLLLLSIMQIALSGGLTLLGLRCDESIKRLKITPLRKSEFLLGYGLSYMILILAQVLMFLLLGKLIFNYVFSGNLLVIAALISVSTIIFLCLGVLLSNWAKTPEAGDNFNRFFTLPAAFLCGVYFPLSSLPDYIQKIALLHPLTHILNVFRGVSNYSESLSVHWQSMGVVLLTMVVLCALSVSLFRWEEKTA